MARCRSSTSSIRSREANTYVREESKIFCPCNQWGTGALANESMVGARSTKDTNRSSVLATHFVSVSHCNFISKGTFIPLSNNSLLALGNPSPWSLVQMIIVFSNSPSSFKALVIAPNRSSIRAMLS